MKKLGFFFVFSFMATSMLTKNNIANSAAIANPTNIEGGQIFDLTAWRTLLWFFLKSPTRVYKISRNTISKPPVRLMYYNE